MDKMPKLRMISNFGVGVDHINLHDAKARHIPVGNTPNLVDGATADMAFALLMVAARNLVIGDRFSCAAPNSPTMIPAFSMAWRCMARP